MAEQDKTWKAEEIWLTGSIVQEDSIDKGIMNMVVGRSVLVVGVLFLAMGMVNYLTGDGNGRIFNQLGLIILALGGLSYWIGRLIKNQERLQLALIREKIGELNQIVEQINNGNANPEHLAIKYLFCLKDVIQLSLGIKHFTFGRKTLDLLREGMFSITSNPKISGEIKEDIISMSVKYQIIDEIEEKYMRCRKRME